MAIGENMSIPYPAGVLHRLTHQSELLVGNPLNDPFIRALHVYTPHGHGPDNHLPLMVDLASYGSSGLAHANWTPFGENLPERLDRLIATGAMPPAVVASPDCHTFLGGNQYINSAGTGRYADYLIKEIVPFVEQKFNCGGSGRRGLFGKSSGGFGALWHAMHHADFWSAIVSCAGDCGFETCYLPDIYLAAQTLTAHDLSIERFIAHINNISKPSRNEFICRMICALAATYDPDPESCPAIRLPIDMRSALLIPERWQNWLRHDPAIIAAERLDDLRQLKGIRLECGWHDEFHIQFGTRRLSDILTNAGIDHVYEEFDGGHMNIDHRLDIFLPWIAQKIES